LKVGVAQINLAENIPANVGTISRYIKKAMRKKISLLCFPECSLTGYIRDFNRLNLDEIETALNSIQALAVKCQVNTIVGTPYLKAGRLFNSAVVFLTDGRKLVYCKNILTDFDRKYFDRGRRLLSFKVEGVKCGILICRDQNNPAFAERYRQLGVKVIFILAAHFYNPEVAKLKLDKNRAIPIARAIEASSYVIKSNAIGSAKGTVSLGNSIIVNPSGYVVAEGGKKSEALLTCELQL